MLDQQYEKMKKVLIGSYSNTVIRQRGSVVRVGDLKEPGRPGFKSPTRTTE